MIELTGDRPIVWNHEIEVNEEILISCSAKVIINADISPGTLVTCRGRGDVFLKGRVANTAKIRNLGFGKVHCRRNLIIDVPEEKNAIYLSTDEPVTPPTPYKQYDVAPPGGRAVSMKKFLFDRDDIALHERDADKGAREVKAVKIR